MMEVNLKNLINRFRSGTTEVDGGSAGCSTKSQEIRNGTKHQNGFDEADAPAPTGPSQISTTSSSSSINVPSICG